MTWFRRTAAAGVVLALLLGPAGPSAEADPSAGARDVAVLSPNVDANRPTRLYTRLQRAWRSPGRTTEERAVATRNRALEFGILNIEPAARALLLRDQPGDRIERAEAAIQLAPELPLARMALARARWAEGEGVSASLSALADAVRAIPRHLESWLWLAAIGTTLLATALVGGSLLFLFLIACSAVPRAAHDLGDLFPGRMPTFARASLLGSLLLVPLLLGEGAVGAALIFFTIGYVYTSGADRLSVVLAAALLLAGLFPVARQAGHELASLGADPVADAAYAVDREVASTSELARLEAAASSDPLALQVLAVRARRDGDLEAADSYYRLLLAEGVLHASALNNAANVKFIMGDNERAIAMYEEISARYPDPIVFFNLSQAYGRAIRVDDLNRALTEAQRLDREAVAQLTRLQGELQEPFVADLPLSRDRIHDRMVHAAQGDEVTRVLRASVAPGLLGSNWELCTGVFASMALFASLVLQRFRRSRSCPRCGARLCARCEPSSDGADLCASCIRLFRQPETTDSEQRTLRLNALKRRQAGLDLIAAISALAVPGSAGILAGRPAVSFACSLLFAIALASFVRREGAVADPLVAGWAGSIVILAVGAAAGFAYLVLVASSLRARRRG